MSKSKGNVINPLDLLKDFDPEIIKYYFAAKMSIENDNVFEKEFILQTYNSDLVNTIGNLVSRTLAMIHKNFSQSIKFKETNEEHDLFIIQWMKDYITLTMWGLASLVWRQYPSTREVGNHLRNRF